MKAAWAALRPNRFELVAVGVFSIFALGLAVGLAGRLLSFQIPIECFHSAGQPVGVCVGTERGVRAYLNTGADWSTAVFLALAILPPLSATILGVALVGKDLDQGTTKFLWSMGPSRRRWLSLRAIPVCLVLIAIAFAAGVLADVTQMLLEPGADPGRTFAGLGFRGLALVGGGMAAFGLSLVTGSILGRLLPAILVSAALVALTYLGVNWASEASLRNEVVVVQVGENMRPGRILDALILTPEGELLTLDDAYAKYGADAVEQAGPDSLLKSVAHVNPSEIYPLAVLRIAIIFGAVGLSAFAGAFAVVKQRRP